jgi:hypothetical protein
MALPFVGVDGEGGDLDDGSGFYRHEYTMLRAGDEYVTGHWLDFLSRLPKKKIHVAYFFDYDVTMMCRDLDPVMLKPMVADQEIRYGPYKLTYRPRKQFTVAARGRKTTINDVGSFFQCPFVDALTKWNIGTVEERRVIGEGKGQRAKFGALTPETIYYNGMECRLLVELMDKFRRTCELIGYLPARWQGPGQLAKAMFKKHGIPKTQDLPDFPPGVWDMAQRCFYGGRFEPSAVGPVRGPLDGWDIGSAYPYACTLLPCLQHATWKPTRHLKDTGMYSVTFSHAKEQMWYGLPVRTSNGSIIFPRHGSGWYWGVELLSAIRLGARITVHHGWEYQSDCGHIPFDFMERLFSIRKAIGKTDAGNTLKLGMNSCYGVTAQSIGTPPYANPIWAGLITAITRARINEAIALDPYSVYMVATDGIFTKPGMALEESDALGGWERKEYPEGMHIVQSGVYFAGDTTTRTRGVPQSAILREKQSLIDAWTGDPSDGCDIQLRQFIGLRLALARNAPHTMGQWIPTTKRVSYDWATKRRPDVARVCYEGIRTTPYVGSEDTWTQPYDKPIGGNVGRALDRLEFADTPDWAETLTGLL